MVRLLVCLARLMPYLRWGFSVSTTFSRPWLARKLGVLRLLRGWITDATDTTPAAKILFHLATTFRTLRTAKHFGGHTGAKH
jgi:hypothetical protein